MAELHEIANTPVTVMLAGREYKARRPRIIDVFAKTEQAIIDDELRKIRHAADMFGFEGGVRIRFMRETMGDMPRGAKLQALTWEKLSDPTVICALLVDAVMREHPKADREELLAAASSDISGTSDAAELLLGIDGGDDDDATDDEKKTGEAPSESSKQ